MVPTRTLESAAIGQAKRLGHGWVGWQHMLLALLSGALGDPAREALDACGATLEVVESHFVSSHPRSTPVGQAIRPNAHFCTLRGRAEGLALAAGVGDVRPVDVLVSLLWDDMMGTLDVLSDLGITRSSVRDALVARGVNVPLAPLREPVTRPLSERVDVPMSEVDAVIQLLAARHPPGTEVWGFNHDGERAWFLAEERIDLQGIVNEALAPPTGSESGVDS